MKTKSPSELRFDPEKHQYWIGKKQIPGVSEILQKVGLVKEYKGIDPFYRDRGIATHKCIELVFKGLLDVASIDPAVELCFKAFLRYQQEHDLGDIEALEERMADNAQSFAGTPDLVTSKAIYDWKCSKSHDRVAELQGQAYQLLSLHNGFNGTAKPFIVVELHDDGTFQEFNYGNGYEQWASVMDLYRWKTGKNEEAKS